MMSKATKHTKRIDISDLPDLLRVVEEVRRTKQPAVLRRGDEDLAIVQPVTAQPKRPGKVGKTKEAADYAAFRAAAGGWADVDTDQIIADIYADRAVSDRPRVDL